MITPLDLEVSYNRVKKQCAQARDNVVSILRLTQEFIEKPDLRTLSALQAYFDDMPLMVYIEEGDYQALQECAKIIELNKDKVADCIVKYITEQRRDLR